MATARKSTRKSTAKKRTTKRAPAKKAAARKASAPAKRKLTEKVHPGFAPGTAVQVHLAQRVEIEAGRQRRPIPTADQTGTIADDGSFALRVDTPGLYSIAGQIDEKNDVWRYVKVPVR